LTSLLVTADQVIEQRILAAVQDVRFWHKADMPITVSNVRFRG
jgi:hypothetical protein